MNVCCVKMVQYSLHVGSKHISLTLVVRRCDNQQVNHFSNTYVDFDYNWLSIHRIDVVRLRILPLFFVQGNIVVGRRSNVVIWQSLKKS